MELLIVHEVSYRNKVIFEMHEFPEYLASRGHTVTFLEFDEGAKRHASKRDRDIIIQGRVYPAVKIRLVSPPAIGLPGIGRVWAALTVFPFLLRIMSKTKFDAVLNYAVPTYGLQLALATRLFGVPTLHRALDVSRKIRRLYLLEPFIEIVERLVFIFASRVSANNPAMQSYVRRRLSTRSRDKVQVHFPPLDQDFFSTVCRSTSLQEKFGIRDGDKLICYMGSFFYFSGLLEALESFAKTFQNDHQIKLLLIGGGSLDSKLRRKSRELGIQDRVIFTGFVNYKELPNYLRLADIAINPMKPSLVSNVALPHKVLQYMAVGLPVISTKLSGLKSSIGASADVTWVESPEAVMDAVLVRMSRGLDVEEIRARQNKALAGRFTIQNTTLALEAAIEDMTKDARRTIL